MLKTLENRINEEINYSKEQRLEIEALSEQDQKDSIDELSQEIEDLRTLKAEMVTLAKYLVINSEEWKESDRIVKKEIDANEFLIRMIRHKPKVYASLPVGWVVDRRATTAPCGYVWINNNKSRFGGERKSGIIKEENL